MTHQIILHDYTSVGRKVAPHNAVPQGTTVPGVLSGASHVCGPLMHSSGGKIKAG